MRKKKLFLAAVILCVAVVVATGFYWYHKPRPSLANARPDYMLSAKDLYAAFVQDEAKADRQYLEKVVTVSGIVDDVQATDSTLSCMLSSGSDMGGINCSMIKSSKSEALPAKGAAVKIKGRCIGYLMDVNLTDAVIEP